MNEIKMEKIKKNKIKINGIWNDILYFFRNKEVKTDCLILVLASAATGLAAGIGKNLQTALICMAATAATGVVYLFLTFQRYRIISRFSSEIESILHKKAIHRIDDYNEGELSILKCEVNKVLDLLKIRTEELQEEKLSLANSLADISHQLKTPLTSLNLIQSLLSEEITESRRQELLREMNRLTDRLGWLTDSLLKISKLDAGTIQFEQEEVNVRELVHNASEPILIPMDIKNQSLILDIDERLFFYGDKKWSTEAVGNVLKNCMEHTGKGGKIWVKTKENPMYLELVIEDNGAGIEKEDLPHLFERFYRGKNSTADSVGIGLALSRMILRNENGNIRAENRSGGGARFVIKIYKGIIY